MPREPVGPGAVPDRRSRPHREEEEAGRLGLRECVELRKLVGPLDLLFLGGFLIVVDFFLVLRIGNRAASIDILPDFLGLGLIALGAGLLAGRQSFKGTAESAVTLAATVFGSFFVGSVVRLFVPSLGDLETWGRSVLCLVATVCIGLLALALGRVSADFGLQELARSWRITGWLFVAFYSVPQLFSVLLPGRLAAAFSSAARLLGLVPLAYLFVSNRRMRKVADGGLGKAAASRGAV